ncbi:hypothetical protein BGZ83_007398 [Gryganskiella cystojenkinii]|nr:hypothetical protein BGZ83_007398 [Gryganskiella cystojenkinii]
MVTLSNSPALNGYLSRMKGQRYNPSAAKRSAVTGPPPPPSRFAVLLSSFIGSFVGISIVASLTFNAAWFVERNTPVIAGSFGASAVLIYGAIEAPLSQPRNVIGGHIMSSIIGVSLYKLFNLLSAEMFIKLHWLLCSLAVSISLCCMQLTHTVHPPASASALIAVTGGATIYDLGYWYVLCPIALGVALMMIVAMLVNNVARRYPTHWWKPKDRKIVVIDQDMSTALADFTNPEDDEEDCSTDVDVAPEGAIAAEGAPVGAGDGQMLSVEGSRHKEGVVSIPPLHPEQQQQQQQQHVQSPLSHHSHAHQHQHHGQFAVYYGGDRKEALKEGERLQMSPRSRSSLELESGHSPRAASIVMEMRGSPHVSSLQRSPSSGLTHEGSAAAATEEQVEEYRSTIEQLRVRVQELEQQVQGSK